MADPVSTLPTSPLYDLSESLMGQKAALKQSSDITERRAQRLETGAAAIDQEVGDLASKAKEHEAARAAAQPAAPTTTKPPSTASRAFLEPGESVLGQVNTVMQGIGLLALGITGGKGAGYAMAATSALKGAAEGWQKGDAERVQRSLAGWQAAHQQMMDQYQIERDAFNDLLTEQKTSMAERFSRIKLRAEVMGMKDLADAARREHLGDVMNMYQHFDKLAMDHEKNSGALNRWIIGEVRKDQTHADLEAHRRVTEAQRDRSDARAEERLNFDKATKASVLKMNDDLAGITNKLETMNVVEEAVDILAKKKILYGGPTTPDAFKAWVNKQTSVGDPQIKWAIDVMERRGVGLLAGADIALGEPASVMRLKAITEPQAGHILSAGPDFWKTFFKQYRAGLQDRQRNIQSTMKAVGALQNPLGTDAGQEKFEPVTE